MKKILTIRKLITFFMLMVTLMIMKNAHADNIVNANKILCASASVIMCFSDGNCESTVPWELNVPSFIEIDFKKRHIATTEASGESRQTKIGQLKKEDGVIFLQGVEAGRAFSFVIDEEFGKVTIAVARQDLSVTVFGSCTPTK